VVRTFTLLLAPFVPHFSEELWEKQGGKGSVFTAKWPEADEKLTVEDTIELVIQVNGKIRDKVLIALNTPRAEIEKLVFASTRLTEWTAGKEIVKKIYVANKLFNIVVK
jgi:leucyl-tRNA synthetase